MAAVIESEMAGASQKQQSQTQTADMAAGRQRRPLSSISEQAVMTFPIPPFKVRGCSMRGVGGCFPGLPAQSRH